MTAAENLLARETSPYLLQHKDNPVHWRPWGPEALAEAKALNRPILLSIGYAACHWCHVMAHESFEDPETADVMNALYINIKVDREERPDIDAIYMAALQLMNIPGGWPLTMFLTPDGEPFWGGTYFPNQPRHGQPSFIAVLHRISEIYHTAPDQIASSREALTAGLAQLSKPGMEDRLSPDELNATADAALDMVDRVNGGFGGAPKFPQTGLLDLLWRTHRRKTHEAAKAAVGLSLTTMAQGGIYDHLAGGFARYTVDEAWLVPHFEKMLYDNAQIIETMVAVWRETRDPLLAQRISETADWVLEDMVAEGGGFAASYDADSDGEEGKFYVWTVEEIDQLLSAEDAALFKEAYDVQPGGNWEGVTILNRLGRPSLADPETERRLADLRATLMNERAKRTAPAWDDKVLTDWNGLMIAALAEAAMAFDHPRWLAGAKTAFDFVTTRMSDGDHLFHSWRLGQARHPAMVDGYANMARAAIVLYEATTDPQFLEAAKTWTATLNGHFWDTEGGGYFYTADTAEALIVRTRNAYDNAIPNANGVMVEVLAKLFHLTGHAAYRDRADALLAAFAHDAKRAPLAMASLWNGFDTLLHATQIVIVAPPNHPALPNLRRAIWTSPVPTRVLLTVAPGTILPADHPAAGKTDGETDPQVFICRGTLCSAPLKDPDAIAAALARTPPAGTA